MEHSHRSEPICQTPENPAWVLSEESPVIEEQVSHSTKKRRKSESQVKQAPVEIRFISEVTQFIKSKEAKTRDDPVQDEGHRLLQV